MTKFEKTRRCTNQASSASLLELYCNVTDCLKCSWSLWQNPVCLLFSLQTHLQNNHTSHLGLESDPESGFEDGVSLMSKSLNDDVMHGASDRRATARPVAQQVQTGALSCARFVSQLSLLLLERAVVFLGGRGGCQKFRKCMLLSLTSSFSPNRKVVS